MSIVRIELGSPGHDFLWAQLARTLAATLGVTSKRLKSYLLLLGADEVEVVEVMAGDGDERIVGPRLEPVDRAAGEEAGELLRAIPEPFANGTGEDEGGTV